MMQLMGCASVEQVRAEGRAMCDIRNLDAHPAGPTDYHYQPINVFTHGQQPACSVSSAPAAQPGEQTTTSNRDYYTPDGDSHEVRDNNWPPGARL